MIYDHPIFKLTVYVITIGALFGVYNTFAAECVLGDYCSDNSYFLQPLTAFINCFLALVLIIFTNSKSTIPLRFSKFISVALIVSIALLSLALLPGLIIYLL